MRSANSGSSPNASNPDRQSAEIDHPSKALDLSGVDPKCPKLRSRMPSFATEASHTVPHSSLILHPSTSPNDNDDVVA